MEEKEKLILDFMSDNSYIPMKAKEMASILCVPKTQYQNFSDMLKKLEDEYKIQKNRKSKYSLVDSNRYITGVFRANEKGFGFVKTDDSENEIYISKKHTKNALNGDSVLIEILDEDIDENLNGKNSKEGRIIKILTRDKDTIVGVFTSSKSYGFVVPDDRKFGTDIFISKKNFGKARNDSKVLVKILKYPENGKNAEGKIVEVLGNINEAGVDMLSLIREYKLPYEFSQSVVEEAQKYKQEDIKNELKSRLDLRNEEIFTIDGEDAKDLDDAVSVKKLENGNYELGVHIADVSEYVKEGSKLDKEAILRGTSIYMLDRVIPMLPRELSNGICSLNQKKDRLTLSVIMEIDNNGNVVSSQIKKSVINVTRRMSYNEVSTILNYLENKDEILDQKMQDTLKKEDIQKIDDEEDLKIVEKEMVDLYNAKKKIYNLQKDLGLLTECKPYFEHFKTMEELAKILKQRREKQGSLNLDIPETKIVLDKDGYAIDVKKYELTFANEIIEQFMLTANETVAETFYWLEAPFIYRVHEEPDEDKISDLNKFLYNFGYKIKTSKDNIHPKAFAQILDDIKGKEEERVISTLILRTLKVARYESENKGHFGIASKCYCHFTSPIRRYPDLFIHRVISEYIKNDYNLNDERLNNLFEMATNYANSSSEREKIAQKVERDSIDIKKAEYMMDKIGEEYYGIVSSVTSFGMFVELENTVEGLIRFENLGNEYFIYDEERKTLIGENSKTTYKIGDKVRIRVMSADKITRQIDFELVNDSIDE